VHGFSFRHKLGVKTAALHHEVVDHAVKDGAVVMLVLDVLQKIFHRLGCLVGVHLHHKVARCGGETSPWVPCAKAAPTAEKIATDNNSVGQAAKRLKLHPFTPS
jgi:hypothetical protein